MAYHYSHTSGSSRHILPRYSNYYHRQLSTFQNVDGYAYAEPEGLSSKAVDHFFNDSCPGMIHTAAGGFGTDSFKVADDIFKIPQGDGEGQLMGNRCRYKGLSFRFFAKPSAGTLTTGCFRLILLVDEYPSLVYDTADIMQNKHSFTSMVDTHNHYRRFNVIMDRTYNIDTSDKCIVDGGFIPLNLNAIYLGGEAVKGRIVLVYGSCPSDYLDTSYRTAIYSDWRLYYDDD